MKYCYNLIFLAAKIKHQEYDVLKFLLFFIFFALISSCKKEENPIFPTITTKPITSGVSNFALSGGIIGLGGNVLINQRGVVWGIVQNPTIESNLGFTVDGEGVGEFNSTLLPLVEAIKYYIRAYARCPNKTLYGNTLEFILLHKPTAFTDRATDITWESAVINGMINPNYSYTSGFFEFGTTTSYGIKIPFSFPSQGLYKIGFRMGGLKSKTEYHYRIGAENEVGETIGEDISFKTKDFIIDIDGNKYSIITIGTQMWTRENLFTKHFNNGDPIPNPIDYRDEKTPGFWVYNEVAENIFKYGLLYNYYAVNDKRNICPVGWHVPALGDFMVLEDFLGHELGGGKLKDAGTHYWISPNVEATNESEFSALPGGYRKYGKYYDLGVTGSWWSSTEEQIVNGDELAYFMSLSTNDAKVYMIDNYANVDYKVYGFRHEGFSVRCIKGIVPWVETLSASDTTVTSMIVHGIVEPNDVTTEVIFEYADEYSNSYTNTISATPNIVEGNDPVSVSAKINGLIPGKRYFYRIKGTSLDGSSVGKKKYFRTYKLTPVETDYVTNINKSKATLTGFADAYYFPATILFEFGTTDAYGDSTILINNDYIGGHLQKTISGLLPSTIYHFRIKARNKGGVSYGADKTFKTLNLQDVTDVEGNSYPTVTIGDQEWMAKNLVTSHFQNGDIIPQVSDMYNWRDLTTPGSYMNMYNFYVINDRRGICPAGWHVPDTTDWNTLFEEIDDPGQEALQLIDFGYWQTIYQKFSNSTGFWAIPAISRDYDGTFRLDNHSFWWSRTAIGEDSAMYYGLIVNSSYSSFIEKSSKKTYGYSVRCIKD